MTRFLLLALASGTALLVGLAAPRVAAPAAPPVEVPGLYEVASPMGPPSIDVVEEEAFPLADTAVAEPPLLTAPPPITAPLQQFDSPAPPQPLPPLAGSVNPPVEAPCIPSPLPPLPVPGQPFSPALRASFRDPLPRTPRWNPPGTPRVGLQVGHWLTNEVPAELARLQAGSSGGGKQEWEVNLAIAELAKAELEDAGVEVDLLPTTVPERYRAHVFVSIHADGDTSGRLRGFKIARPGFSSLPEADDQLVSSLLEEYGTATALPRDDEHVSLRMLYYYAFNSRRYCHAVAPGVPQAIVETGFLTNATDRQLLLGNPHAAARGIARGILAFLASPATP